MLTSFGVARCCRLLFVVVGVGVCLLMVLFVALSAVVWCCVLLLCVVVVCCLLCCSCRFALLVVCYCDCRRCLLLLIVVGVVFVINCRGCFVAVECCVLVLREFSSGLHVRCCCMWVVSCCGVMLSFVVWYCC